MSHSQDHSKDETPKGGNADHVLEAQLRALISKSPEHDPAVVVPELLKELGGFANSASADFSVSSLVFHVTVALNSPSIHKRFTAGIWGAGLPGGMFSL